MTAEGTPRLSIVFVNYNLPELLLKALESLESCAPDFSWEVIVVDNDSKEPFSSERRAAFPEVRWIDNPENRGYAAAANQGIAAARGEYVATAGTDVEFRPGVLEQLVAFLDRRPEAGVVSPQFLWSDLTPQPSARRFPSFKYLLAGRRSPLRRLQGSAQSGRAREFIYAGIEESREAVPVEVVIGAFLVARRELLLTLHGYDEEYAFYVEDVDLCRRVAQAGKGVFLLPQARMVHHLGVARRRQGPAAEFLRLRSYYRYFCRTYPAIPAGLLLLFSSYLALLLGAGVLGIREWEYPMEVRMTKYE